MLGYLSQKKDNTKYVTLSDLEALIKEISKKKGIKGEPGQDAYVTDELIAGITKEATPDDNRLKSLIKPLIPAPIKGDKGDKGKDGTEITAEEIMAKLKSIRGDGRLLIDDIRGGKRILGKMNDLENSVVQVSNNMVYLYEGVEKVGELSDKIKAIEISIAGGGRDTFLQSQTLVGTILTSTLNNGTVLTTDLAPIAGGGTTITSTDGSVTVVTSGSGYDLSVPEELHVVSGSLVAGDNTLRLVLNDASTVDVDVTALNQITSTIAASSVTYDNTTSGLTATDVQAAIDELDGLVDTNTSNIATNTAAIAAIPPQVTTTITNTVTGHKIADYTNEVAATVAINETVTSLGFAGTDLTYTDENGAPTVLDLSSLVTTYTASEGVTLNVSNFELGYSSKATAEANNVLSSRYISMDLGTNFALQWGMSTSTGFGTGLRTMLLGGFGNQAVGTTSYSAILGGSLNVLTVGLNSVIVGGSENNINNSQCFIGGGQNNSTGNQGAVVIGGVGNTAGSASLGNFQTIVGGNLNIAEGTYSAIIGGSNNTTSGTDSVVIGSSSSEASGRGAVVIGASNSIAESYCETVIGAFALAVAAVNPLGKNDADYSLRVGIGGSTGTRKDGFRVQKSGTLHAPNLSVYATNAAALSGGLIVGDIYRTSTGELRIVI